MSSTWTQCGRCGSDEVYTKGPDAVSWCDECGVVEGITRIVIDVDYEKDEMVLEKCPVCNTFTTRLSHCDPFDVFDREVFENNYEPEVADAW